MKKVGALMALLSTLAAGCAAAEVTGTQPAPYGASAYDREVAEMRRQAAMPADVLSPFQYRDRMAAFYAEHGVRVDTAYVAVSMYRQDLSAWGDGDTVTILARTVDGEPADYVYLESDSTFVNVAVCPEIFWVKTAAGGVLLIRPNVLNATDYAAWLEIAEKALRTSPYSEWRAGLPRSEWGRGWRELLQ
jgi:hypothetical protein